MMRMLCWRAQALAMSMDDANGVVGDSNMLNATTDDQDLAFGMCHLFNDCSWMDLSWLCQVKVDARKIVAGLSRTCSQKIHNQLVGVERMHKDSEYILFWIVDDVRLHPGTIGVLTVEMEEKKPEPCSMGFATGGRTFFLWGGCMMMYADDFRKGLYGLVSGLRGGGYSNDMTLAAIAGAHKRLINSPLVAVFPHPLASDLAFQDTGITFGSKHLFWKRTFQLLTGS